MTTFALLLSRQERALTPQTWWLRAVHSVNAWAVEQSLALRTGSGLPPQDFAAWSYASMGGAVEIIPLRKNHGKDRLKMRDREVVGGADIVIAVSVRKGGIMEELFDDAIEDGKKVFVLDSLENNRLINRGAQLLEIEIAIPHRRACPRIAANPASFVEIPENFLWHYTRSFPGPWPGQSQSDYFQALVDNAPGASHSGSDALTRILEEQRIRACGRLIRGKHSVVCFSACPPNRLLDIRKYKPALLRWDFEPYAVGIQRQAAEEKGIRPVKYLAAEDYGLLSPAEAYLFQKHALPDVDFTHEEEWRARGDVDLSSFLSRDISVYRL